MKAYRQNPFVIIEWSVQERRYRAVGYWEADFTSGRSLPDFTKRCAIEFLDGFDGLNVERWCRVSTPDDVQHRDVFKAFAMQLKESAEFGPMPSPELVRAQISEEIQRSRT